MKLLTTVLKVWVLLCMLVGIAAMGLHGATYIVSKFDGLDPTIGTCLSLALCTTLACSVFVSSAIKNGKWSERRLVLLKKSDAYERLLAHIAHPVNTIENEEIVKRKLLLFGDGRVLKEYAVMCEMRRDGVNDPDQRIRLVKAIRSDLGLLSIGLSRWVMSHFSIL